MLYTLKIIKNTQNQNNDNETVGEMAENSNFIKVIR